MAIVDLSLIHIFHTEEMMNMSFLAKQNGEKFSVSEYEKQTYGKSYKNVIEGEMKKLMPICNTSNVGTVSYTHLY